MDCNALNADTTYKSMKVRVNTQLALYRIRFAYVGIGWNMSELFDLPDQPQVVWWVKYNTQVDTMMPYKIGRAHV